MSELSKICRAPSCTSIITSKKRNLCSMHRSRWEKNKSFDELIRTKHLKCTIKDCDNDTIGRKICDVHRARFRRNGHYHHSNPRPKILEGYVQWCKVHGFLKNEQTRKSGRAILCKECVNKRNRETKFIELDLSITELRCCRCKLNKSLSEFTPYHQKMRWPYCKECALNSQSIQYTKHKHHFKRWYNLSVEQYNELLDFQNNKCAICNRTAEESQPGKNSKRENNLAVDHCHKLEDQGIMAIRGLLCFSCNAVLGKFKDDIKIFERAIEYLKQEPVLITKNPNKGV